MVTDHHLNLDRFPASLGTKWFGETDYTISSDEKKSSELLCQKMDSYDLWPSDIFIKLY